MVVSQFPFLRVLKKHEAMLWKLLTANDSRVDFSQLKEDFSWLKSS